MHPTWRRQWHPTPVLLPGKSHGCKSLEGCSPWGRKELDVTEWLNWTELISSDVRIATPAFFCFPFAWNVFFHPLTFSLYVSWGLKWVSCRQHIYGSSLCIHSVCVRAVNPFTFKAIIDIYVPIAIFLIGVDFVDLFPSLVFLDYISPFNICCKAGLVVLNSLNFCLSEMLFISPSILNEILAGYGNLGCRFFPFSTLNISCHSLVACRVSAERSAVKRMGLPLYITCCFSLAAFNILSLV